MVPVGGSAVISGGLETARYYRGGCGGRAGNWVDGIALRRTGAELQDQNRHLAKVGVAGSNPVVRSKRTSWSEAVFGLRDL
jgi:hypothetical protein